jgi:ABC-type multidrug transport system fused ATPase/permease subunit
MAALAGRCRVNLWVLALIVGAAAAAAIGLMYLIRRRSRVDHFFVEIERGAGVFAVIGTAFAVILAFVVLEAFGSFNDARTGAEQEASLLVQISRNAEFFPPDERDLLEGDLICYGRSVIYLEWPAMKDGRRSPVTQTWVVRFQGNLKQVTVENPKQEAAFLTLLDQADQRTDARRARLTEANRALPAPVWFFLAIGAVMTIGFALFFADRREHFIVQGFLIGAVTTLVVSGLLLVWFLDHPYENQTGSIKPDEMQRLLPIIEAEHGDAPLPCDEHGNHVHHPV